MNPTGKSDTIAWTRRRALQAAAPTGGAAQLQQRGAIAQNLATTLLRAPKQALIIGNSSYKRAPLLNPGNDAKGMAEALKTIGFDVALGMDLSQAAMSELIQAYVERLAKTKAIGLFYFAGHGTQLAWRNYIVPLDAEIANVDSIKERCIDINTLIAGIRKAGNPMNVIILDACRDNPFGSQVQLDQKGLSQLDAPPGTFLAYATAPGNTAIDGEGANGLYTEHLLREIKVPEAKIEDVFKRVRLSVRRGSKGLQIPWESTSLEEDFWFVPPKALKKLAEAEIEREFQVELGLWEKIKTATQPDPLEDYLRRYPGGHFSELAQLQLDQVLTRQGEKKIQIISSPENPYSKGTVAANTAYKVGDSYSYIPVDTLTKLEGTPFTRLVTGFTDAEVIFNDGNFITDLLGNRLKNGGEIWSANQAIPAEFVVGKRWGTRFRRSLRGIDSTVEIELVIAEREQITVPAGTFYAFRVDARGWHHYPRSPISWDWKNWYAPEQVRQPIAYAWLTRFQWGGVSSTVGAKLLAFSQP